MPPNSAQISRRQIDLAIIDIASGLKPTTSPTQQHTLFHGIRLQPRTRLNPSKVPNKTDNCLKYLVAARRQNGQKTHTSAVRRINSGQNNQVLLLFCRGMGVATQTSHQSAKTSRLVVVKGRTACNTSGMG